jgi:GGDEF domain-containing protein
VDLAPEENYDPATGLLSKVGLERALDTEMSRAARHELPLVLVYVEIMGLGLASETPIRRRVLGVAAESLLGRVRAEDRVARVEDLRFAVLAPEADDARAMAARLGEHVLHHLKRLADEGEGISIVAAGVECQYDEMTVAELLNKAELELSAALLEQNASASTLDPSSSPNGFQNTS